MWAGKVTPAHLPLVAGQAELRARAGAHLHLWIRLVVRVNVARLAAHSCAALVELQHRRPGPGHGRPAIAMLPTASRASAKQEHVTVRLGSLSSNCPLPRRRRTSRTGLARWAGQTYKRNGGPVARKYSLDCLCEVLHQQSHSQLLARTASAHGLAAASFSILPSSLVHRIRVSRLERPGLAGGAPARVRTSHARRRFVLRHRLGRELPS